MKKLLMLVCGIVALFLIIYIPLTAGKDSASGNENEEYEYEYYYNDSSDGGEYMDDAQSQAVSGDMSAPGIDVNPDSYTVFVNKEYGLPKDYVPDDLMVPDIRFYGGFSEEKSYMRKDAGLAIEKMFSDAEKEGYVLYGISGYRSYARQEEIYNKNVTMHGSTETNKVSAEPGHSEHQSGLTIDISIAELTGSLLEEFGSTEEGIWVKENCSKYGYIIRYPKNKEKVTGYSYEPWHLRYVGKKMAEYLTENKLTLEEYFNYIPISAYTDSIISDVQIIP